jgi:hypothetical protein
VTAVAPAGAREVEAARLVLAPLGVSPDDLLAAPPRRPVVPTFADYVPVASDAVGPGTRRVYGSCWNRIVARWGQRRLDEPTPSEVRQQVKAGVVVRRNARGGRSAAEHAVAALRCLYRHAEDDKLIDPADSRARKVDKPRRCPPPGGR